MSVATNQMLTGVNTRAIIDKIHGNLKRYTFPRNLFLSVPVRSRLEVELLIKSRTMQTNQAKMMILVAFALCGIGTVRAQDAVDKFQPLVQLSARRLALAEQVALAKWDSHTPVEDPSREEQVIMIAVSEGKPRGLDGTFVSKFFRAQIEANKVVQYSLLANWYRTGRAPGHAPVNLANTVRPELDHLQTALIAALADTSMLRAGTTCHADVAKAVGKYISAHKGDRWCFQTIALDRALAAACRL
jgi:chorismate mutase